MMPFKFTSSKIGALASNGRSKGSVGSPFKTYVTAKYFENKLHRRLEPEIFAKPTTWGWFMEIWAFDKLPLEYSLHSRTRYKHPDLHWSGMPDFTSDYKVGDIKCPYTILSFCIMIMALEGAKDIGQELKRISTDYYWQLISSCVLTNRRTAVLAVYMPYKEDLMEIQHTAANLDIKDQHKYWWISNSDIEALPYLKKAGQYKDINIFEFEVSKSDIDFLTQRVELAGNILFHAMETSLEEAFRAYGV